jgi:hypothetical protein
MHIAAEYVRSAWHRHVFRYHSGVLCQRMHWRAAGGHHHLRSTFKGLSLMKYIALCVFLFMTGCTTTPPVPQTPRQMLLAAQETLFIYVDAIGNADAAKLITPEQKTDLLARADKAFKYLEDTRLFLAGIAPKQSLCTNTTDCLTLAQKVLTEIQRDLPQEKTL